MTSHNRALHAGHWVKRNTHNLALWAIVFGSFAIGYTAYTLRQPFFYPDSRYYLAMAFWFGGESQESARELTAAFGAHYGQQIPEIDQLFGWGLVQPRVVLPLLAAIPVKLFGPFGLAATVLVIFAVMTVVFTLIIQRRYGNVVAAAVMLLINSSHYLMMFNGGMLTESLSALWSALTLVVAWHWMERRRPWILGLLALTVVGAAFTRQATFIVAGAFVIACLLGSLIQRRWNDWTVPAIVVAITSLGCQILQALIFPSFSQLDQFYMKAGADNLVDALRAVPRMTMHIINKDVNTFLHSDVPLLLLILLAIAGAALHFRRPEAHLLLGGILGTALYNVTNGTPTQFRYAIPGLIFFVIAAALAVKSTADSTVAQLSVSNRRSENDID
ncbi:hypothetical protein [Microbacterium sp. SD291]|uniref:hypothetical protein n=1 Tax=Microbacterium sp. SD291 TaxID=2782007 RepID=UPI001A96F151|nr:hypothetical protein [Microbacterium sp. SD291]MBO0979391.1 hypothetical protein [Microbacterium sp. SD291]